MNFFEFAKEQKKLIRMASFYQKIRTKMNILIDENNKPIGGKWSYDEDNRKKLPDKIDIPKHLKFQNTSHTEDLKKFVEEKFKSHPGSTDNFLVSNYKRSNPKII